LAIASRCSLPSAIAHGQPAQLAIGRHRRSPRQQQRQAADRVEPALVAQQPWRASWKMYSSSAERKSS
jgi:hypothetical protein